MIFRKKEIRKIKIICDKKCVDRELNDYSLLFYSDLINTLYGKRKYLYLWDKSLKIPEVHPTFKDKIEICNELLFEELPDFLFEELKLKKVIILEGPNKVGKTTIIHKLKNKKIFNPNILFRSHTLRKDPKFYPLSHYVSEQIFDYALACNDLTLLDRIGYFSSMAYRPMHRRNEYFQILEKVKNHIYVLLPYNYLEAYPENEELYKEYKYLAERMNLRVIDKYAIKS